MSTLRDLSTESYQISASKGWHEDDATDNFPTKLALIHSEVSEVLEEFRNGKEMKEIYFSDKGKPEGIPIELVDILIRVFDLAGQHDINLDYAYQIKTAYNKTRPHRHGGKKC